MTPSTKVLAIFCLAGLLSSLTYTSYSAWVSSLPKADAESHQMGLDDLRSPNYDPSKAYERWYAENVRLTKYYDRKWPIFCFSFPVAMSLALLIAAGAGWLQRVSAPVMFCTLIPVYVAPGLVLTLCAVSWFILLIPSLALAGYLLRLSVQIYTSHRPRRFVLTLLIARSFLEMGLFLLQSRRFCFGRSTALRHGVLVQSCETGRLVFRRYLHNGHALYIYPVLHKLALRRAEFPVSPLISGACPSPKFKTHLK